MAQDPPGGGPVPAAKDPDVARLRDPAERRMNQRLVVTIFVAGGELKIAVEEEPEIVAAAGEDDPLERRRFGVDRSEEHTSELQSLMRISHAVFCLTKKKIQQLSNIHNTIKLISHVI